jgi:ribosomal-protein-alanine N-acetyltransferase
MLDFSHPSADKLINPMQPLGAENRADCAELHANAFVHPWNATDFEGLLSDPQTITLGVVKNGADAASASLRPHLAGFVMARIAAEEAEILTIAVDPQSRQQGLGTSLLAASLRELSLRKVAEIFLEVDETNSPARALYAKFGFYPVGSRKSYYRTADGDRANALILRKDISKPGLLRDMA